MAIIASTSRPSWQPEVKWKRRYDTQAEEVPEVGARAARRQTPLADADRLPGGTGTVYRRRARPGNRPAAHDLRVLIHPAEARPLRATDAPMGRQQSSPGHRPHDHPHFYKVVDGSARR